MHGSATITINNFITITDSFYVLISNVLTVSFDAVFWIVSYSYVYKSQDELIHIMFLPHQVDSSNNLDFSDFNSISNAKTKGLKH